MITCLRAQWITHHWFMIRIPWLLSGNALEGLLRDYMAVKAAHTRLSVRFDPLFLEQLVDSKPFSYEWDVDEAQR